MQKGVVRKRRPAPLSEYGRQLQEKQELKKEYHLKEKQMKRYVKEVLEKAKTGESAALFFQKLEQRFDSIIFRAGMAQTRAQARQMVSHGHFLLNKRPVDIPSCGVKKGDVIIPRSSSQETSLFKNIKLGLKKYEPPSWIELNKETMEIKITGLPSLKEGVPAVEIPLIFEFYSR